MTLLFIFYCFAGILIGILATMFGFGGGFVVVPLLFWLLPLHGVPTEYAMHIAIGTSLMLMFINMLYASWLHYLKQNIDLVLLKRMLPLLLLGAITGSLTASELNASLLKIAFIILISLVLLRTIKQEFFIKRQDTTRRKPGSLIISLVSFITGVIASLLGIGGSVIIVPFFRYYNFPMAKASGLANALAVPSGLIGSIIFALSGMHLTHLPPYSTGYIYWPALLCIFLGSILGAKIGMYCSGIVPEWLYGKIYALLLCLVIMSMAFN